MRQEIVSQIIELAERNIDWLNLDGSQQSAVICLNDAKDCRDKGLLDCAVKRAIASLEHSVGVFHPDCKCAVMLAVKSKLEESD